MGMRDSDLSISIISLRQHSSIRSHRIDFFLSSSPLLLIIQHVMESCAGLDHKTKVHFHKIARMLLIKIKHISEDNKKRSHKRLMLLHIKMHVQFLYTRIWKINIFEKLFWTILLSQRAICCDGQSIEENSEQQKIQTNENTGDSRSTNNHHFLQIRLHLNAQCCMHFPFNKINEE